MHSGTSIKCWSYILCTSKVTAGRVPEQLRLETQEGLALPSRLIMYITLQTLIVQE